VRAGYAPHVQVREMLQEGTTQGTGVVAVARGARGAGRRGATVAAAKVGMRDTSDDDGDSDEDRTREEWGRPMEPLARLDGAERSSSAAQRLDQHEGGGGNGVHEMYLTDDIESDSDREAQVAAGLCPSCAQSLLVPVPRSFPPPNHSCLSTGATLCAVTPAPTQVEVPCQSSRCPKTR
jgi:hypothetical protein